MPFLLKILGQLFTM